MKNVTKKVLTIYAAMSGGVDSSVAAALLKKRGFNVVGVFFKPWSPSRNVAFCNWQQDRQDAMAVASKLGIKFKTWDFSKDYGREVARYMIDSYRGSVTPNPDVMCNKEIKFGLFLKRALAEGADLIATGHYARVKQSADKYKLLKAKDLNKDQSYFLYTLRQRHLKHCLFPIGEYAKPQVRKLAKKFGLPNFDKKDSQGVCFVGQLNMKDFLKRYIKPKQGQIKLVGTGQTIGWHDGVYYYTIGQRHGLNLSLGGGPYYVASKDKRRNIIFVAKDQKSIESRGLSARDVNWVADSAKLPLTAQVKIRYRSESLPALITANGKNGTLQVKLRKVARAVSSGQSAVFYRGQEVLGGGVIDQSF